ncbi:MAG: 3-oxoacyl-[acyl-carrier-protein] reductase [Dehalococcoidia bacterium]|nr:3-oxoacyl-[acyl-carrier-protein] reductase [Dehalococcoidia bacterium]
MEGSRQRLALVTGSSRGIGKAIALRLAALGHKVVINYLSHEDEANEVVRAITDQGGKAIAVRADVTKADDVEAMFRRALELGPTVEILVNNAGIIHDSLLVRMSDDTWDQVIDINLRGSFLCTRAALRNMLRNRWGRIINVGSVVGMVGNPGQANYAASKAGLIGFTQSVSKEVASRNVTVNCIAPGYITTDIVESLPKDLKDRILGRIPLQRFGQPEEIAGLVAYLVGDEASYVTGQVWAIDGGLSIS